jgi:hypothetical protein
MKAKLVEMAVARGGEAGAMGRSAGVILEAQRLGGVGDLDGPGMTVTSRNGAGLPSTHRAVAVRVPEGG